MQAIDYSISFTDLGNVPFEMNAPVIELCPECGEGQLIYKRLNCKECLNCNWSLCGM